MSDFETPCMDLLFAIRKLRPDFNNAKMREERLKELAKFRIQMLRDLANRVEGECASLRKEHPWLEEFETTGSWLALGADNEFIEKPKDMVHTLIRYTDRWLGERTAREFGPTIDQVVERTVGSSVQSDGAQPQHNAASVDEKNPNKVTKTFSRVDAVGKVYRDYFSDAELAGEICGIWKSSKETAYTGTRPMSNFPAKVVKFAHKHGNSVNIHGFAGGKGIYEVDPSTISNLAERLIVQALKPDPNSFKPDGDVEWATERARFI